VPKSLRRASRRKPGGQPGHEGTTLRQRTDPDVIVRHEPAGCHRCGSQLRGAEQVSLSRRQVFDIPPITGAYAPSSTTYAPSPRKPPS